MTLILLVHISGNIFTLLRLVRTFVPVSTGFANNGRIRLKLRLLNFDFHKFHATTVVEFSSNDFDHASDINEYNLVKTFWKSKFINC